MILITFQPHSSGPVLCLGNCPRTERSLGFPSQCQGGEIQHNTDLSWVGQEGVSACTVAVGRGLDSA